MSLLVVVKISNASQLEGIKYGSAPVSITMRSYVL
ncbi:unnamed protein product [Musa acuminata subsp. malaccensis]|uniref:(wild Malaysian banana) hypothetical protein n=1 Tax=Musa acuminata subsp. malaccensis TaxID=214687 RepID=A0A804ITR5_MUSAM|nr:unnamed protein product [Musa acuminata subsp. malaccensis]